MENMGLECRLGYTYMMCVRVYKYIYEHKHTEALFNNVTGDKQFEFSGPLFIYTGSGKVKNLKT